MSAPPSGGFGSSGLPAAATAGSTGGADVTTAAHVALAAAAAAPVAGPGSLAGPADFLMVARVGKAIGTATVPVGSTAAHVALAAAAAAPGAGPGSLTGPADFLMVARVGKAIGTATVSVPVPATSTAAHVALAAAAAAPVAGPGSLAGPADFLIVTGVIKTIAIIAWLMGSLYRSKHELVFVFRVGKAPHLNTVELGRHGRNRTNVWDYASVNSLAGSRREDLALHPTVKPAALVADAIEDVTHRGGLVLDVFLGSGTTLIAAERTGRRFRGVDIDPFYVDVASSGGRQ